MAWSAALRRDPPLSPASQILSPFPFPPLQSLTTDQQQSGSSIAIAVIDANALISSSSARLFGLANRFVSVREVLEEVRDPASRFHLASLPFNVEILEPSDDSLRKVSQFARETGDLQSLSAVDLKLLALAYMLEEQSHGSLHLRSKPPPLQVLQASHLRERDLPGWGSNVQNLEEWENLSRQSEYNVENHDDSHILGLKKLSLNTSQPEKCVITNELKDVHEEDHASVNGVECNKQEATLSSLQNMNVEPSLVGLSCKDKLNDEDDECGDQQKEEVEEGDDEEWQKTLSRSTRRKHERRAARDSRKNAFALKDPETVDIEQKAEDHLSETGSKNNKSDHGAEMSEKFVQLTMDEADSERDCANACEGELVEDSMVNGVTRVKDTEGEGDNECSSIDDEHNCREEHSSVYATESEDSWLLQPLSNSNIACITADFPMQNVLLQIGLRVISPNGLQIQKLNRWVLKCEACRHVTSEVGRIFCPKCGNGGTLYKVSVTIGSNGVIHTGSRRRANIRGTKYSLPMPKGGRQGILENPILREDQLPKKMLRPKKKKSPLPEFSTISEIFDVKRVGNGSIQPPVREALAVFSGKRNPNDCRSKPRR